MWFWGWLTEAIPSYSFLGIAPFTDGLLLLSPGSLSILHPRHHISTSDCSSLISVPVERQECVCSDTGSVEKKIATVCTQHNLADILYGPAYENKNEVTTSAVPWSKSARGPHHYLFEVH